MCFFHDDHRTMQHSGEPTNTIHTPTSWRADPAAHPHAEAVKQATDETDTKHKTKTGDIESKQAREGEGIKKKAQKLSSHLPRFVDSRLPRVRTPRSRPPSSSGRRAEGLPLLGRRWPGRRSRPTRPESAPPASWDNMADMTGTRRGGVKGEGSGLDKAMQTGTSAAYAQDN